MRGAACTPALMTQKAICFSRKATTSEIQNVVLAAWLHDADDPKLFKTKDFANARRLLKKHDLPIEEVINVIKLVSCRDNLNDRIEDELLSIPREADRVDATGQIGITRAYQFTVSKSMPLILPDTTKPSSMKEICLLASETRFHRYRNSGGKSKSMVDHYYDKLLRIANIPPSNVWLRHNYQERFNDMTEFLQKGYLRQANHTLFQCGQFWVEIVLTIVPRYSLTLCAYGPWESRAKQEICIDLFRVS